MHTHKTYVCCRCHSRKDLSHFKVKSTGKISLTCTICLKKLKEKITLANLSVTINQHISPLQSLTNNQQRQVSNEWPAIVTIVQYIGENQIKCLRFVQKQISEFL
eukprot:Lithocolla_globosa_v1_NODE_1087_length_2883_cov_488.484441.p2 type:complete len:105 gc:universal NODE_1087_length_2883_cov_488.484441:1618-1304(-)